MGKEKTVSKDEEEGEFVCVTSLGRVSAGSRPVPRMLVVCLVCAWVSAVSLRSLGEGSSSHDSHGCKLPDRVFVHESRSVAVT